MVRRKFERANMEKAVANFRQGGKSLRRLASEFNVNYTSLWKRCHGPLKNKEEKDINQGGKTFLTPDEEESLVEYSIWSCERGFGLPRQQFLDYVGVITSDRSTPWTKEKGPGKDFWYKFLKRHKEITMRKADAMHKSRAIGANRTTVEDFFQRAEDLLNDFDVKTKPHLLYNMDESALWITNDFDVVLTRLGQKHVHKLTAGTREHVTFVACGNAAGHIIPPAIIYQGKRVSEENKQGGPPGATYYATDSAYMVEEKMLHWLDHFNKHRCKGTKHEKVMLFLDGASPHVTIDVRQKAKHLGIELIAIPPHTSHLLQPLDVSCNGPIKKHFKNALGVWRRENPLMNLGKKNFPALFAKAHLLGMTPANIISGFRASGLFPFNKDAISKLEYAKAENFSTQMREQCTPTYVASRTDETPTPPGEAEAVVVTPSLTLSASVYEAVKGDIPLLKDLPEKRKINRRPYQMHLTDKENIEELQENRKLKAKGKAVVEPQTPNVGKAKVPRRIFSGFSAPDIEVAEETEDEEACVVVKRYGMSNVLKVKCSNALPDQKETRKRKIDFRAMLGKNARKDSPEKPLQEKPPQENVQKVQKKKAVCKEKKAVSKEKKAVSKGQKSKVEAVTTTPVAGPSAGTSNRRKPRVDYKALIEIDGVEDCVMDVPASPPEFTCPSCGYEVNDEDPYARGCDNDATHWWHKFCLPEPHQAIVDKWDSWDCPVCLIDRVCGLCHLVEQATSDSSRWVSCARCQGNWHRHCLPEQDAIWAAAQLKAWTCRACNQLYLV